MLAGQHTVTQADLPMGISRRSPHMEEMTTGVCRCSYTEEIASFGQQWVNIVVPINIRCQHRTSNFLGRTLCSDAVLKNTKWFVPNNIL